MKKILLFVFLLGITSVSVLAADEFEAAALSGVDEETPAPPPKKLHRAVSQEARTSQTDNLVDMGTSRVDSRLSELERRVSQLERDKRFTEDKIRSLDREIEDLKRRR